MENASKALLIAGSILIVIVLVSISILILNSTSEVTDQAQSTSASAAVQSENSTFTKYFGNSIKGAQVKTLIQEIIVFNSKNGDGDPILLNFYRYTTPENNKDNRESVVTAHRKKTADLQTIYNKIENTANYQVNITPSCTGPYKKNHGYTINGRVGCISITKLYE